MSFPLPDLQSTSVNPNLRQYRINYALFTSRNPDFYPLARCCVLKVHSLVSRKDSAASGATQECARSPTNV